MTATSSDVGLYGLVASLVLVAVAAAISRWQHIGLEGRVLWASLRALVQLLLVGGALTLLLRETTPLAWSWAWVAGMTAFAADVIRRRVREVPGILPLALLAYGVTAVLTLGVLFGLGIFPLEARALVPLAGMMVGNSMNATVVAARRVVEELSDKRAEVEARLALGRPWQQAGRPYLASALRTALTPQVETTKSVGLVFLPGAMTGLILAGVDPLQAVLVQAVVMFLVLAAATTSATVIAIGAVRRCFTADHRLRPLPRPAA